MHLVGGLAIPPSVRLQEFFSSAVARGWPIRCGVCRRWLFGKTRACPGRRWESAAASRVPAVYSARDAAADGAVKSRFRGGAAAAVAAAEYHNSDILFCNNSEEGAKNNDNIIIIKMFLLFRVTETSERRFLSHPETWWWFIYEIPIIWTRVPTSDEKDGCRA